LLFSQDVEQASIIKEDYRSNRSEQEDMTGPNSSLRTRILVHSNRTFQLDQLHLGTRLQ